MEYKLSNVIQDLNTRRDYLGHIMIMENEETLQLNYHILPSYGYYDPDYEDTEEWYDTWWRADITFNKETGIVISTGFFNSTCSGATVGDRIIIDCDYKDYIRGN